MYIFFPVLIGVLSLELNLFLFFKELFNVKSKLVLFLITFLTCVFFFVVSRPDSNQFLISSDQYLIISGLIAGGFYLIQGKKRSEFYPLLLFFLIENIFINKFLTSLINSHLSTPTHLPYDSLLNLIFQILLTLFLRKYFRSRVHYLLNTRKKVIEASVPLLLIVFCLVLFGILKPSGANFKGTLYIDAGNNPSKFELQDSKQFVYAMHKQQLSQLNSFFLLFLVFLIIVALYIGYEVRNNRNRKRLETEKITMENYIDILEKTQLDIQKVQHDYKNMLIGISGFINDGEANVPELEAFLKKNRLMQNINQIKAGTLNQLKKINIPAVKGLVSTKVIEALQKGISVDVECNEEINIKKVDPFDLSRALGIIMDNAIEECENHDQSKLQVAFIDDERRTIIIINNTCSDTPLNLAKIKSTKGKNRGFGLKNLNEIIDSSTHLTLETDCVNSVFTQKISIKK